MGEFQRFEAMSFDCYGTLIDWETGIMAELVPWANRHQVRATGAGLLGAFAQVETVVQREEPGIRYPEVLAETLRRIGSQYGPKIADDEAEDFGASVGRWPAFADSAEALARLKTRYRLVILSNVDAESFALSNERLRVRFDLVVTAEDVGAYKPSPLSFPTLLERLDDIGVGQERLVHVAQSLYHDHEPAKAVGLSTVWIDRRHDKDGFGATPPPDDAGVSPDWRFTSLAGLADAALM